MIDPVFYRVGFFERGRPEMGGLFRFWGVVTPIKLLSCALRSYLELIFSSFATLLSVSRHGHIVMIALPKD